AGPEVLHHHAQLDAAPAGQVLDAKVERDTRGRVVDDALVHVVDREASAHLVGELTGEREAQHREGRVDDVPRAIRSVFGGDDDVADRQHLRVEADRGGFTDLRG